MGNASVHWGQSPLQKNRSRIPEVAC